MVVELEGGRARRRRAPRHRTTLATPMEDPRLAGLTKRGRPSASSASSMTSVDQADRATEPPGGHREAVVVQHRLGDALVHADGGRQHAGADVGQARAPRGGPGGRRPHRRARAGRGTRPRPGGRPASRWRQRRCRGLGAAGRRVRAAPRPRPTSARTRSASTHCLSWVSPMTRTANPRSQRGGDDPTRRDARHLVLGRRAPVDDRQHSRVRHRPRLYNRPRGAMRAILHC